MFFVSACDFPHSEKTLESPLGNISNFLAVALQIKRPKTIGNSDGQSAGRCHFVDGNSVLGRSQTEAILLRKNAANAQQSYIAVHFNSNEFNEQLGCRIVILNWLVRAHGALSWSNCRSRSLPLTDGPYPQKWLLETAESRSVMFSPGGNQIAHT